MNREDIIKLAQEAGFKSDTFTPDLERFAALIAAVVCEKCATVCEDFDFRFQDDSAGALQDAAAAIRARGNT